MKTGIYMISQLFVLLILFNSTQATVTYAYFEMDTIGFIKNFCENTDKPELQCNGKCHLKKVAESQDKKQNTPTGIVDFKELVFYTSPVLCFELPLSVHATKQLQIAYQNLYSFQNIKHCFHPPKEPFYLLYS